ncbi:hypothetical protein JMA_17080 [Jeotgalibacillus malaysiensis]|uniref:Coupling factor for flagellin transcription and translation n=1 Tax=Jeotgalibacillus malaysiensis TaxID=1508404 RepID=A0A0B5AL60_9BACL|nr:hypothetical protein [Jeotgalibacillus malaysiensis]AJD91025.1 hypothetical protein JMA_17080 [Jeotgalibacillus malaysiensis]
MVIFLLILSIIFNIAAFLSIYLLFLRQNRLINKEVEHEKTLNEIEQTFTGYLLEMKEENEQFLKQFEKISNAEQETDKTPSPEPVVSLKTARNLATAAYKKPEKKKTASTRDQAKQMVDEGYTIEEVAKELKKGKTEVELMLKFNQS